MDKPPRDLENACMIVCKHVRFSGRVQGVGFRFTTQGVARGFEVTGYVRNLPSGAVEVVAQGDEADVRSFLQAIEQRMSGYIHDRLEQDQPVADYSGFTIRY